MIQTTALTKRFGKITAVDDVSLFVPKGAVVGFLGPNGAGKTTTIRMICGYLRASAGQVTVNDIQVQGDRPDRRIYSQIGYLPESAPLYHEMRVIEYLRFRARLFGLPRSKRKKAIDRALEKCMIHDVRRRPIGQLSKGYRQRVGLAASILHDPPVLILDEPTVGLDPNQIRAVRTLIRDLAGEHTVLLSTHILPEVERTCDRYVMIAGGRLRMEGIVADLQEQTAHSSQYFIETRGPGIVARITGLDVVADLTNQTLDDGWSRITVTTHPEAPDQRQRLAELVAEAKVPVREISRQRMSLEQLFVDVVGKTTATKEKESSRKTEAND